MFGEKRRDNYRYPYSEYFYIDERFMYFKSKGRLKKIETRKDGVEIFEGVGRKWFVKDNTCYAVRYLSKIGG